MATTYWTADRRLYLDKDGAVVEASSPARVSLLVAAGAQIPLDQARRLGLAPVETAAPDAKAAEPKANKARVKALENK